MRTSWSQPTDRTAQASGMVSVQCGCSVAEALDVMNQLADGYNWSIDDIADAVVERRMRFSPPPA